MPEGGLIRCKPLPQVQETIPYDEAKDAARYADCPGGRCAPVKKVVMKVPVE